MTYWFRKKEIVLLSVDYCGQTMVVQPWSVSKFRPPILVGSQIPAASPSRASQ